MKITNEKDFWSGVMFFVVGLAFVLGARYYDFGTTKRMGAAYFPTLLGGLLVVIGVVVGVKSLSARQQEEKLDRFHISSIAWVVASVCLFAVLLKPAGLLLSIVVLVMTSMLGSHEFKWKEAVAVCVVMMLIVWAVFIYGLNLSIPMWPKFAAG